ncbi:sn-glycerol-3-phosphate ABC transporter ATP-binding protein UgpC [Schlegelella sp. S2-27]|uniref:Sn-glycerol-3-phosphate ABC transporter ATP-binding protein UgpC n=1 Tax=Caldimonas mangrovi TaxID=2944811 RepID=A0ABT0YLK9_9BURK|nr:sn-glycerol-3-phosphate ABC transporter ATP-binding protein UgpC [Caldimonas mangrovi]MCM5679249.1 sn-glycerol-3-phosphate ABC transporter ATP-binding protein UgpC [Caldimonas mangrovi]
MANVSLSGIRKQYESGPEIIRGVDLDIRDGEFMVFVGPSGCGKSTLMRMIAGLEEVTAGEIHIGDRVVNDVPPAKRGAAMVFQSYALYPHMSVAENMGFALKLAGRPKREVAESVHRAAEILQITHLLDRKPKALSGGQRQRVAIGRAIVRKPAVFLFDEPLSNLDAALRVQMRVELTRLHRELGSTMIYVTHDQTEAMTMGDRIAVFNHGRVEQVGEPIALYREPGNRFVAGFLGSPAMNFLQATLALPDAPRPPGVASWGVRPESWELVGEGQGLAARVELVEHLGDVSVLYASVAGQEAHLTVKLPQGALRHDTGQPLWLRARPDEVHAFDAQGRSIDGAA